MAETNFVTGLNFPSISAPPEGLFEKGYDQQLPPRAPNFSLFDLPERNTARDINKQLLYRAALKQILFDDKPTKDDFSTLQKRALEDLTTIAGWLEKQPDLTISEDILAVLDPKKVRENTAKCLTRSKDPNNPPGLPRASCAIKGKIMRAQNGRQFVSDGKKWVWLQEMDDPSMSLSGFGFST